jgi:multisubunit Na+/H+ antiporter MnhB subunit
MTSRVLVGVLSLALFAALGWAVLSLPVRPTGLTAASLANLPESGVTNPVTAVLLNYRGYDTLLEVGVLLLAIVAVWSLRRGDWPASNRHDHPLLMSLLRGVLPMLVLAAGYLLWIGAFAPGGAFQGGALLGGAIVLVVLGGLARRVRQFDRLLRAGLVLGVIVFAAVCAVTMRLTGGLLQFPAGTGGTWIMVIESAALISIGLTLGLLYVGGRPHGDRLDSEHRRPAHHA